MSYTNVYPSRINWENEPSIASPINATNLNKIDYAVYEHDQTLETWDVTKANQSDLLLSVKSIDYNTSTGVFLFTWQNGTTKTVDLNIEKIPVSFSMDANGVITMTTDDGTQYTADVGALIKTYTFTDSSVIDFTVTTDQSGNKTVTADIVDGSITGTKLQPNYLADCTAAKTAAENAETGAEGSAEDSEAWAIGTRDGVPVPNTDPAYNNNSKYWAEHTSSSLSGLTDTDINNPSDGQTLVYNSSSSKWENADQSAGGGSKITVTTTESTLYGENVTLTQGGTTLTAAFSNSGVAIFEGVTLTGTVQFTATDGHSTSTRTLNIPYFGNYDVSMAFFSATITVTFPASNGATCTCNGQTATTSPYTFNIGQTGTYTATCTLDGVSKTQSFTITTDGQTETHTFEYGTINLTFDNEFRGLTLTCTDSSYTITKTAPSTGNTMVFYPNETNTWTISGTYSGVTYTTTAEVSSLSTPVSAILQTIPDGSTVTPTDVIQTWLKCATINDKSYTTLNEVLADTDTFTALLQDSNACDYMARSTTWSTDICADADAMRRVGMYDYCSSALLGNSTWLTAICNSTYRDSILDISSPNMTDATHPSGEVKSCPNYTTNYAYYAFDGNNNTHFTANAGVVIADYYIEYDFTTDVMVKYIKTNSSLGGADGTRKYVCKIQGYDEDASEWVDISDEFELPKVSAYTDASYTMTSSSAYKKFRMVMTNNTNVPYAHSESNYALDLAELKFYGRHETQTNIIHSAVSDTLYYNDGSSQTIGTTDTSGVGTVNWSNLPVGNLTIYSTVANDPDDLTSAYSKTVRITPHTTEVWLMPDKALWWYGYNSGDMTFIKASNSDGSGSKSTYYFQNTFGHYDSAFSANVSFDYAISKINSITETVSVNSNTSNFNVYFHVRNACNVTATAKATESIQTQINSVGTRLVTSNVSVSDTSNNYVMISGWDNNGITTIKTYALWLE